MSIQAIIDFLSAYSLLIVIMFIAIPLIAFAFGEAVGEENAPKSPYKYIYSMLVYLSSVPGIFSVVLCLYGLFILKVNLLEVNLIIYFVPLVSMIATIILIKRVVALDDVPGFDRLYGLFVVLGVSFTIALMILQTRIFIFFGSSISKLIIFIVILFLFMSWGMTKLTGKKSPEQE